RDDLGWNASVLAWSATGWILHASGTVAAAAAVDADAVAIDAPSGDGPGDFYAYWAERGLEYGSRFQALRGITHAGSIALGLVELPEMVRAARSVLHPVLLDAAFQTIGALLRADDARGGFVALPRRIEQVDVLGAGDRDLLV